MRQLLRDHRHCVPSTSLLITKLTLSTPHLPDTHSRHRLSSPLLIFTLASWMAVLASGVSGCLGLASKCALCTARMCLLERSLQRCCSLFYCRAS